MYEVKADKLDVSNVKRDGIENAGAGRRELSVRSKKPKVERTNKGDGSIVLVRLARLPLQRKPTGSKLTNNL